MTFADLVAGEEVFLDANTLVFHFSQNAQFGAACTDLLRRIALGDVQGFVSTHILTEVAHRLMLLEASALFGWPQAGVLRRLQKQPALVQQLTAFRQAIDESLQMGIQILSITPDLLRKGAEISQQTGLLSNDALLVAVMREHGLTNLASHDADFDRVPGLTRYGPA